MKPFPRGYLPTLDGWRAVAILLVIAFHASVAVVGPLAPHPDPFWFGLTRYGAKGVDLFFGISGLLICSRLLEEYEARGAISLKGFYTRRFLRILPPYVVYLIALVALGALGTITLSRSELLASAAFVRNYRPLDDATWYTSHLWSLAVEEHFYLLWPALLVLWKPARARWGVLVFALAIAAWRVAEFRWQLVVKVLPDIAFYMRTDTRLDALLWGCWFALILRDRVWRDKLTMLLQPPGWLIAFALLVLGLVINPPLALLWESILVPLVIVGTMLNPHAPAGRLLESAPFRWIGRISYSLYLWQQLFLVPNARQGQLGALQYLPLSLALVLACAVLSYYVVERPMIRVGHRLAQPTTEGRV